MLLVDYSSSGSDNEDGDEIKEPAHHVEVISEGQAPEISSTKRKAEQAYDIIAPRSKLPPLPTSFHSLYASNVRKSASDDPTLHGGRKRQVPHVLGNWPSHVYLEWFPDAQQRLEVERLVSKACVQFPDHAKINTFLASSLGVQQPLHISLSAPIVLTTATKDNFHATLTNSVQAAKIPAFHVMIKNLDWVSNFEGSRYFLILRLQAPKEHELDRLLKICNDVCEQFDLPLLYQRGTMVGVESSSNPESANKSAPVGHGPDVFHISIAWTLDEFSEDAKEAASLLDLGQLRQEELFFKEVKVKIGNVIESIGLTTS